METEYDGYVSESHGQDDGLDDNEGQKETNQYNNNLDLTETELSQDLFYEDVTRLVKNSLQRRDRRQTVRKQKRKRSKTPSENPTAPAYSRCSVTYLFSIIKKVRSSPRYVQLLEKCGFHFMLELDDCIVPRHFAQWVADHVNTDEENILIGSSSIPIDLQSIKETLGICSGHIPVPNDEEAGKTAFLALLGLDDIPSIRFFGDKILGSDLEDDDFMRSFVAVSLGCFLCPNSNTKLSTKYMGALVDTDKIKDLDWAKFIHEWLIWYIKKYLVEKKKGKRLKTTLGGCIYHLAVRCLDFVDFGSIKLPSTMPRIKVWKGNLIKCFSDLFMDRDGKFGALPIKEIEDTCYRKGESFDVVVSKELLNPSLSSLVNNKVKESIVSLFKLYMKDQDKDICIRAQSLVTSTVEAITCYNDGSQTTEKLESSQGNENTNEIDINSGNTEKVQSDERHEEDDEHEGLIHRKRRRIRMDAGNYESGDLNVHSESGNAISQTQEHQDFANVNISLNGVVHQANATDTAKTVSLDYMLPEDNQEEGNAADKMMGKCHGTTNFGEGTSKIDHDVNSDFSGFANEEPNLKVNNILRKGKDPIIAETKVNSMTSCRDIDINLPNISIIAEHYANLHLNQQRPKKRSEVIEEARSKYHFYDDATPSFRLLESEDDRGVDIEEPELWRPLGMNDEDYRRKVEEAKINADKMEEANAEPVINVRDNINGNEIIVDEVPNQSSYPRNVHFLERNLTSIQEEQSPKTPMTKGTATSSRFWESVQCAQNQNAVTDLTVSPLHQVHQEQEGEHVDLVTPETGKNCVTAESLSKIAFTDNKPHDYSKAIAIGRRLYPYDVDDDDDEVKITGNSNVNFIQKININSEVQILGERKFKDTCNSMTDEADEMYNTNLCLGSATSSSKENFVPRRVVNASKYLVTPYANDNSQIMPGDRKHYETIITLPDIEEFKTKWAVEFDNCRVSVVGLGNSLKVNGWVDSYVINCLCRKKFKDKHPRNSNMHYFFSTTSDYFLEKWQNEETRLRWKKNVIKGFLAANGARALHLSERLYFPSLYIRHWIVFAVDLKARNFLFLDSINGENCQYSKDSSHLLIKNFKEIWHLAGLKNMRFETFRTVYPNVPKQNNGNDCGIFATQFLNYCPRNPATCRFSWKDVPDLRIKLANELQFCTYNELQDSIIRVLDFDPKKYMSNEG